jgi:SAM-dependent methyltransferase
MPQNAIKTRAPQASPETPSWVGLAAHWHAVATPLRPGDCDAAYVQRVIATVGRRVADMRVLLLGVTPELSGLSYPPHARLLAVDFSAEMLAALWTPARGCASIATRGRWESLPVAPGSIDLVLMDASFCALPDVRSMRRVLATVAQAMRPRARLCGRSFVAPARPERLADILRDMHAGRAGSVHAAKWRIAMSLQGASEHGVALADVWRVFEHAGDLRVLGALNGWSEASMRTLDAYRGASSRLCFPTLELTRRLFGTHFDEIDFRVPDYELGERCPMFLLRRR